MRSYPPFCAILIRFEFNYWIITLRDKDSYLRNPIANGRPQLTLREESHGFLEREKAERNSREKKREKSSPAKPFPNQPRCAHVLRIAADLNQP